jgi:RNA polymerase sigma-70 factor (ECF subfamily)
MMRDEKSILKRLKAGDVAAIDAIYLSYNKKLYSFTFSLLKDHNESEDLIQDVFVTLWEKRDQINPDLKFENYLFTICYNSARKFFRRKNIEYKVKDYLLKNSPESIPETENTVIYNELMDMVERAVEKLPPRRKLVFKLSRQEYMQIKEIAESLSISSRTAESHLTKALSFIKKELEKASLLFLLYFYLFIF